MTRAWTTTDDGRGRYRDPRLPKIELRWEGETFELWTLDNPNVRMFAGPGLGSWTRGESFEIFSAEEAPDVSLERAHAVAQALFDLFATERPEMEAHFDRFPLHDCGLAQICPACLCCGTQSIRGCTCAACRCGLPGKETGLAPVTMAELVRAAADRLLAGPPV